MPYLYMYVHVLRKLSNSKNKARWVTDQVFLFALCVTSTDKYTVVQDIAFVTVYILLYMLQYTFSLRYLFMAYFCVYEISFLGRKMSRPTERKECMYIKCNYQELSDMKVLQHRCDFSCSCSLRNCEKNVR